MNSGSENSDLVKIDLYDGAFGKTLFIKVSSLASLMRLGNIFEGLARCKFSNYELLSNAEIVATGVKKVTLCKSQEEFRSSAIKHIVDDQLEWQQKPSEWMYIRDLIQPLIDSGNGHQYLTKENVDAVLVKLSYNES